MVAHEPSPADRRSGVVWSILMSAETTIEQKVDYAARAIRVTVHGHDAKTLRVQAELMEAGWIDRLSGPDALRLCADLLERLEW